MTEAHIYVDEYAFGPETSESCRAQFSKLFDANLHPVPSGTIPPARVVSNVGRRVTNYAATLAAKTEETKEEPAAEKTEEDAPATEKKEEAPEEVKSEAPSTENAEAGQQ